MANFDRVLLLETSGRIGIVAVGTAGRIAARRELPEARRHARDLAVHVRALLGEMGWRARNLTAVVVGAGPGSYTGLRVGIASAKALAYATGGALFAVPTFDAIAAGFDAAADALEIIADAQQECVYAQRFRRAGDGAWRAVAPIAIRPFEEWASALAPDSIVVGPGLDKFAARLPARARTAGAAHRSPEAAALLRLAGARPDAFRTDAWRVEPIYLRGSSAEEKRHRPTGPGA